jgi:hypothetical protein
VRRAPALALALGALLALAAACRPELDDRPWLITRPAILGWKAEPPEAPPGATVTLQVVALDPAGPLDAGDAPDITATTWTLCHTPKPVGESRAVAADCLAPAPAPDATGDPVTLAIPADACRLFGPDVPQPLPGAPATRPRDPDATGGYYQPIALALDGALAVGLARVTCDLPDASLAVARAFQDAYHANQNPALTGLAFAVDGAPADPSALPPGARVTVTAAWQAGSAESFPVYDRASRAIVDEQEALAAAWFATGGQLDRGAAQVTDPSVLSTATTWLAPPDPGAFEVVLVLRDSRGGSDTARATLLVKN